MVSPLGAEIVSMCLEDGVVDRTRALKRREAARRQTIARRIFGSRRLDAHPDAMHVWLTLPANLPSARFTADAARQGIVVPPSSAFWTRKTPPPRAVRISLGGADETRSSTRGLSKLASLLDPRG